MGNFSVHVHSTVAGVLLQDTGQVLPAALPTFFDIISNDEDTTLRSIVQITNGVTSIVDKVQTLLTYWEKKYKHMWDQDKEAYIRQVVEQEQEPHSSQHEQCVGPQQVYAWQQALIASAIKLCCWLACQLLARLSSFGMCVSVPFGSDESAP